MHIYYEFNNNFKFCINYIINIINYYYYYYYYFNFLMNLLLIILSIKSFFAITPPLRFYKKKKKYNISVLNFNNLIGNRQINFLV